jgi:putative FmdB family regulatory protein
VIPAFLLFGRAIAAGASKSIRLTALNRMTITLSRMPTYEYACEKCGHEFEKFQSMSDKPLTTCPEDLCGKKKWGRGKVSKKIGAGAGLIFKGSGFYITDYRSEGYKEAAKKDAPAPKTESKETKPAAAAPATPKPAPKAETKPAKRAKD